MNNMFSRCVTSSLFWRRSFSISTVRPKDACYKAFEDKVREYRLKSPDGKPVDPTPEYYQELEEALGKLAETYGGGKDVDLLEFPKFQIPDIEIDPISVLDLPENKPKKDKEGKTIEAKEAKGKKDDPKKGKDDKDKKAKAGGKDDKKDKKDKPKTDEKKK